MRTYNDPPPNLAQGIHLVQSGDKRAALVLLRRAAQDEPLTAEGWLWLAAATDDLAEYRQAVTRALRLDPHHPVARRMRAELERLDGAVANTAPWLASADTPPPSRANTAAPLSGTRRRVLWAALVLLAMAGLCALFAGALVAFL
ncbi:MAG: hypothetical protein M5U29_16030 [Anaerolineae bacterium]|nr:hypothetical protein [Anaerolineae bacterium]